MAGIECGIIGGRRDVLLYGIIHTGEQYEHETI